MDRTKAASIGIHVVGAFVLFPSVIVSLLLGISGLALGIGQITRGDVSGWFPVAVIAAGWFGIASLWRLYALSVRGRRPRRTRLLKLGLICGVAVSIYLSMTVALVFAWPIIGAAYFWWRMPAAQPPFETAAR